MSGTYHKEGPACGRIPYDLRAIRRYSRPSAHLLPRLNFLPGNAILKRRLQKSQWKEKEKEREETDIASG